MRCTRRQPSRPVYTGRKEGTITGQIGQRKGVISLGGQNALRIWSLAELVRYFEACKFLETISWLKRWETISQANVDQGLGDERVTENFHKIVQPSFLEDCAEQCRSIDLRESLKRVEGPTLDRLVFYGRPTWATLAVELRVLREMIEGELSDRRFVFIPERQFEVLEELDSTAARDARDVASWRNIWSKIPSSEEDSREAINCYSLGRNTACVFHLMRVAEHGLRMLARKLRVSLTHKKKPHPIEYADWEKVINAIKVKITAAHAIPIRGKRRAGAIRFYSDAADHCSYMKDIWRNDISHAGKPYLEPEALGTMQRVKAFMGSLIDNLKWRS